MKLRSDVLLPRLFYACALVACASVFASAQNHVPQVEKIEPPSWWANHSINPVRLLVRGRGLNSVSASAADGSPFEVSSQTANLAGTYMFVNLRIDPAARPGDYDLV